MVNRQMKRFSTSLIIRGMQMKTTVSYQLTSVNMAVIKKPYTCWLCGCGEYGTPIHGGIGASAMENSMKVSQKMKI